MFFRCLENNDGRKEDLNRTRLARPVPRCSREPTGGSGVKLRGDVVDDEFKSLLQQNSYSKSRSF